MLESSESSHTNVLTKKTKLSCRNGAAAVGVVLGEPAESCLGPGKFGRKFPLHTPPLCTLGLADFFRCSVSHVDGSGRASHRLDCMVSTSSAPKPWCICAIA